MTLILGRGGDQSFWDFVKKNHESSSQFTFCVNFNMGYHIQSSFWDSSVRKISVLEVKRPEFEISTVFLGRFFLHSCGLVSCL